MRFVYAAGAVLAAIFMVLIALLTLFQVVGRFIGAAVPDGLPSSSSSSRSSA